MPRPPSAPVHHERTQLTPHLSPKKEAFNNLLNKGIAGKFTNNKEATGYRGHIADSSGFRLALTARQ